MTLHGKRIAVLMGGPGSEREVSMASGRGVARALRQGGAIVDEVDVQDASFIIPEGTDIAFNVIHGTFGEDGQLQRLLAQRGVPFTGEGAEVSRVAFDKILSKQKFLQAGVPTAEFEVLSPGAEPTMSLPYVLKAPREGSSVGVVVVKHKDRVAAALEEVRRYDSEIMAEGFFSGRELTVGILGQRVLPVIEICPKDGVYDFKNKYPFLSPGGGADHYCPADLSEADTVRVQAVARDAAQALGLEVYGRVDIMLAADGSLCVLEINTIPGMTESSLLPEAAAVAGMDYVALCAEIIRLSLKKGAA